MGMGHSPEAGYNLDEAHHTGWKPELAVLVEAMWPAKAGYHNLTCGGKEYHNVACRNRIPQFACGGKNTATEQNRISTQTSLFLNDLTLQLRKFLPSI